MGRLVEGLRSLGHDAHWLALADPAGVPRELDGGTGLVLPRAWGMRRRLEAANAWCRGFSPEVASLHFTPFSLHPRGLAGGLAPLLGGLAPVARRHLVVHEPWVGIELGRPWRERILGLLQRGSFVRLVRTWRPALVQTSNAGYARVLAGLGIQSVVRPIFSNLPLAPEPSEEERRALRLQLGGGTLPGEGRLITCFGLVHREWAPEGFARWLASTRAPESPPYRLVSVGRCPGDGAATWDRLGAALGNAGSAGRLGEAPSHAIAAWLATSDWALTSTPLELLGKSGTVAASLDHGLPVIVPRSGWPDGRAAAPAPGSGPIHVPGPRLAAALSSPSAPRFPRDANSFDAVLGTLAADLERLAAIGKAETP